MCGGCIKEKVNDDDDWRLTLHHAGHVTAFGTSLVPNLCSHFPPSAFDKQVRPYRCRSTTKSDVTETYNKSRVPTNGFGGPRVVSNMT